MKRTTPPYPQYPGQPKPQSQGRPGYGSVAKPGPGSIIPGPGQAPGPYGGRPPPQMSQPPRSMLNPGGRVQSNPQLQPQPQYQSRMDPKLQRQMVSDKLIADCYSKLHFDQRVNRNVNETSYQTHVLVKEFSSYPDRPPPTGTISGSVKTRVLVLCIKYSGRILLQKGKLNEERNLYQIGRTWDLDELKSISKLDKGGFIFSLNKVYFWEAIEGYDILWQFIRSVVESYGRFTGKYPQLTGITLEELKLPPTPNRNGNGNGNGNGRNASVASSKSEFYKDYDFTSNGQLPMKPMKVLSVDRPNVSETSLPGGGSGSLYNQSNHSQASGDGHSFVFGDQSQSQSQSQSQPHQSVTSIPTSIREESPERKIHEYAKQAGSSPLRKYKPLIEKEVERHPSNGSDLASAAALGLKLQNQLDSSSSNIQDETQFVKDFAHQIPQSPAQSMKLQPSQKSDISGKSPDFGIEEITDESDTEDKVIPKSTSILQRVLSNKSSPPKQISQLKSGSPPKSSVPPPQLNPPKLRKPSTTGSNPIDTSIQEIESMLDTQINFNKSTKPALQAPAIIVSDEEEDLNNPDPGKRSYSFDQTVELQPIEQENSLNIVKKDFNETLIKVDKDTDADDFFEDVSWTTTDTSNSIIKKLTQELNKVKLHNVSVLMDINFGNSTISKEVTTAMSEVENLSHIFKKLEIDFNRITPDIETIENNSQGLQVKSINKKILYNDLKSMLERVKIDPQDLKMIASYDEFDNVSKLLSLEGKLLELFNASTHINNTNNTNNDSLSSMKALKQYQSNYEVVAKKFVKHFLGYLSIQFRSIFDQFQANLDRFHPHALLRQLSKLTIYSGLTFFVKGVGSIEFVEFNHLVNSLLAKFFDQLISARIKAHGTTSTSTMSIGLSHSLEETTAPLRSSRTLRLSKKVSKFSGIGQDLLLDDDNNSSNININNVTMRRSTTFKHSEVEDPKFVIQTIEESTSIITLVQYFMVLFFHIDQDTIDFNEYLSIYPYEERLRLSEELPEQSIESLQDGKNHSTTELITTLSSIFNSFINIHLKKLNPFELNIPVILVYLEGIANQLQNTHQAYVKNNFIDRFQTKLLTSWNKFIVTQLDSINNSIIVAKSGILQPVKNINQILLMTESSLESHQYELRNSSVKTLVDKTYSDVTEALVSLFSRDDPLLKKNELDDKERERRNVTILQNVFYILDELSSISRSNSTNPMRSRLDTIFNSIEQNYFQRLLHKNIGKLVEFVSNYEALENMSSGSSSKKYNKKFVKTLLSNYTTKELQLKVGEIFKKLEKHFISGTDMFEKDLLDRLWSDLEQVFIDYFTRLNKILRSDFDRDIDFGIGRQEIHSIFKSIH
ncbi:exocyst complex component Sec3-domain-containing protein [Scheffersomyces amazonensis]|uniref:exocyst complex component Sec3-domain-containing protein n=1 Tax=Scheffersomyces amazonensis TaxID=1078765 RepID=UPI00315CE7BE